MDLVYANFNSIPDNKIMEGIIKLHYSIFGDSDSLVNQMKSKPQMLIDVAMEGEKVIAYKIGYALDNAKFYSWLGGVDADYRNYGVASKLMDKQHQHLIMNGYKIVQTKTMNKWRSMLILNIKNGFDVIGTYNEDNGETKIILEKKLFN
ncbi:GNAT family N-acetyltransferase [Sporosarcina sp. Marseille-Q4063]|uniref:GNAT family N-acetyltransferase n=1 Tax=Sporosarcina sp. Marseille-Q4063 TaxID=2810514 RepID=UPI001BAF0163|nr:GNAT family N-acetyltransferase [Sporosarcina sp. Marseille-Q4063]QUW23623.1 GNAT family N-acetyltransferase [Sporosarcina sp. Marseille-Q4063]